MVKKFFEGIKDDIKETIAPPKRALIVVEEGEAGAAPTAGDKPAAADPATEGYTREPGNDAPLKALPVEPLDTGRDEETAPADEPAEPRPARAVPVTEDELIEDMTEEP
jgi:hypothetical protein